MKLKAVSGIMLTLLLIGMLILTFNIQPLEAEPTTIIVPDDYGKIQWAIGNASDGDTILVRAETYYENIVVNKMVNLRSVSGPSVTKVVAHNASGHVFHVTVNHVNISGFTVMGATGVAPPYPQSKCGILLDDVSYCKISNNTLINNNNGIYLYKAVNNTISGNTASNNSFGFYLYLTTMKTGYCIIKNNVANSSKWSGFYVYAALYQNITLTNNTANWNGKHGLFLEQCPEETIVHNTMSWNNGSGICLRLSDRNTIRNNEISNNKIGINCMHGSSGNAIYHNNFIDNENQAYMYESVNNTWDNGYPSGGNYWSDHVCIGNPSDGSQPYIIDADNIDRYPFQDPNGWIIPGDVNGDGIVDIQDVIIAALAFGSTVAEPNIVGYPYDSRADLNNDGIINIIDLVIIAIHFGMHAETVDETPPSTSHDYDNLWHTEDFTINLTATDDPSGVAETFYIINDGPIQNVSTHGQPRITDESANNTLEYWSINNADNEELPHKVLTGVKLDKTPPTIGNPTRMPEGEVQPNQAVKVTVNVTDFTSGVEGVRLAYFINNETIGLEFFMAYNTTTGLYFTPFGIPGQQANTLVRYAIRAYDNAGNLEVEDNAGYYYVYTVIPEFPLSLTLLLFMIATLLAVIVLRLLNTTSSTKYAEDSVRARTRVFTLIHSICSSLHHAR